MIDKMSGKMAIVKEKRVPNNDQLERKEKKMNLYL